MDQPSGMLARCCPASSLQQRYCPADRTSDPQSLQIRSISRIDKWIDYVRRTGDAKSTVRELAAAQADLKTSLDLFLQRKDFAAASLSVDKIATIQRLQSQWQSAAELYQAAIELGKRANRTDYQTTALADLAFSELQLGQSNAAESTPERRCSWAPVQTTKISADALDRAGEVEVKRGNLVAAGDYLDRALAISDQIDDKKKVYLGYMDRAEYLQQIAVKCDYQRNFDVCLQSLELARTDYQKALEITQKAGYSYISQSVQSQLKELNDRKALIQSRQRSDQTVTRLPNSSVHKSQRMCW